MKAYVCDRKIFLVNDITIFAWKNGKRIRFEAPIDLRKSKPKKAGVKFPPEIYKYENSASEFKKLRLRKSDYARYMQAMNSDIPESEKHGDFVVKPIGNYIYVSIKDENGDYIPIGRTKIDKDVDDYVKTKPKKKRRRVWHFPSK